MDSRFLIVTGFSGAGMTSALKHLEDMGYETFDNFPLTLVPALRADPAGTDKPVAIGIDTRARGFEADTLLGLARDHKATLIFMTADEHILLRRFTETRRRHPLAQDRPASAGIKKEQEILYPLRAAAAHIIDTSEMSVHDLRHRFDSLFALKAGGQLTLTLMSFGFRYGLPREADIVLDVRFLKNPHWNPALKPLTGLDRAVGEHVAGDPAFAGFLKNAAALLAPLLPRYAAEGKSYLTVAVGCTGGRHRSVYTVEKLKEALAGAAPHVLHRDVDRG